MELSYVRVGESVTQLTEFGISPPSYAQASIDSNSGSMWSNNKFRDWQLELTLLSCEIVMPKEWSHRIKTLHLEYLTGHFVDVLQIGDVGTSIPGQSKAKQNKQKEMGPASLVSPNKESPCLLEITNLLLLENRLPQLFELKQLCDENYLHVRLSCIDGDSAQSSRRSAKLQMSTQTFTTSSHLKSSS